MEIQHANPYYDDSYAVNSANLGPYGDAITYELIPAIEKKFRGIGQGWARFLYGGSTGGWEASAARSSIPMNTTAAGRPARTRSTSGPIRSSISTSTGTPTTSTAGGRRPPRPGQRNYLGEVSTTLEDSNHRELVLGTHSRSGDQCDIWEAVFSPVGEDGYPKRIWDKMTGRDRPEVAAYWQENYDLRISWSATGRLGPKLKGKIHIYAATWTTTTSTTPSI